MARGMTRSISEAALNLLSKSSLDQADFSDADHLIGSEFLSLPCKKTNPKEVFTFLCLGIVCPRKNQIWTANVFKEWNRNGQKNARLVIVGARYCRTYEVEYLDRLKALVEGDETIELHDVTTDVDTYFRQADCLILTSLNEVTPLVISEAFAWGIPVISTDIAGIKEMYKDGVEGFLLSPGDEEKASTSLEAIYTDTGLRTMMRIAARERFEKAFDVDLMVERYRQVIQEVVNEREMREREREREMMEETEETEEMEEMERGRQSEEYTVINAVSSITPITPITATPSAASTSITNTHTTTDSTTPPPAASPTSPTSPTSPAPTAPTATLAEGGVETGVERGVGPCENLKELSKFEGLGQWLNGLEGGVKEERMEGAGDMGDVGHVGHVGHVGM